MRCLVSAIVCSFVGTTLALAAEQQRQGHSMMGGAAKTTEAPAPKQRSCPVTGKVIREDVFVEQGGLKVYFSSPGAAAKFKESPTSYLPAVYKQIYPQVAQVKCPVSGDPVKPTKFVDFIGARIYFCCDECPKTFKADPAKYLAKMKAVSTEQVHCPVTGKAIDPGVSTRHLGKTVYFSSKDALAKFLAAPAKYVDKLRPEVGVLARGASADDDIVLTAVAPPEKAVHNRRDVESTVYQGKTYFLGSADDVTDFKASPATYAAAIDDKMKTQQSNSAQWFTCSMDPDVLQQGPGKCPKCGMDLIPVKSTGAKTEHAGHGAMKAPAGGHGGMMQGPHGGGHGGMMQGQQPGRRGGMMQGKQDGGHPGCSPLGHEH